MNYIILHTTHKNRYILRYHNRYFQAVQFEASNYIWIVTELLQSCGCEKLHGEHRFGKVFVLSYSFREKYALFFSPFLRPIIAPLQRISGRVCLQFFFLAALQTVQRRRENPCKHLRWRVLLQSSPS